MKIFDQLPGDWISKVNFVDDNNVVLGYDMGQCCCEHADWFIADKIADRIPDRDKAHDTVPIDMPGWNFDPAFFKKIERILSESGDYNLLDDGGMVVFRIVNGDQEKFVHLFNVQNGYYGHGFTFKIGEVVAQEGTL